MADNTIIYPDHQIDPRDKGYEFVLQYHKAAYADAQGSLPMGFWFRGFGRYDELKSYALNRQPADRYKEGHNTTDISDATVANKDYSNVAILPKFREIALAKLLQRQYKITASAIDETSRSEEDADLNKMKVKLLMRQSLQQQGSPLANSPMLQPQQGEPQDMEQMQMMQQYGYKHLLAQDAELAIQYVHQFNNMEEQRKRTLAELFDIGLGGYKEWLDDNGMTRTRECIVKNLVISYCQKPDFSDAVHIGEIITVRIADIISYFTAEQIDKICEASKHQWGNPRYNGSYPKSNWNLFKVQVLDLEFLSWNTTVYKTHADGTANTRFEKTDYKSIRFTRTNANGTVPMVEDSVKGQPKATFTDSTRKDKYKGKWIIGTDMMYDWGLAENQNRKPSIWWETTLSYHLYAWNFYEMRYSGILERLIPIADSYQQKWMRLQDLQKRLLAYMVYLDLDAIDSVALAKGGKNMTPQQLVDFMFKNQVMLFRSSGGVAGNPNYKPAWIEDTGQIGAFAQIYQGMVNDIQLMYQVSGLNEATADAPSPDMNMQGQQFANQATDNALYLISEGDKYLQLSLADAIVQKVQIAVSLGKVEGYVKALGQARMQFFKLNPEFSLREFGIAIKPMPSPEERTMLLTRMQATADAQFVTPADWMITERYMETSMDAAAMYLTYVIKKAKDRAFQEQQANIKQQGDLNMQNAQLTAQMQERQMMLAHQLKMEEIQATLQGTYLTEMMKKGEDVRSAEVQAEAKKFSSIVQANAKIQTTPKQLSL
jgi:hypothetical protein